MEDYNSIKNRQLQAMLLPAREKLKKYTADELCGKCGIDFDEINSCFLFKSMGLDIRISYPEFDIQPELGMWHYLTLLQYMDTADGSPLSGKFTGLQDMRGGLARGRGFDKDISEMFARGFKSAGKDAFKERCLELDGEIIDGKADVTAKIWYAPRFPVLVNFWEADDEFPASAKMLVDENAEHYLTLEAAGGACASIAQKLTGIV